MRATAPVRRLPTSVPEVLSPPVRGRILVILMVMLAGGVVTRPAEAQSSKPLPVLTTIKAIRALSQDEGARGYPVRVRAIVTHIDEKADVALIMHDGDLGQFV